jgi:GNAT superfamily N-acetyltransferase
MEARTNRMDASQLAEASQVLARAFWDDPMIEYLMPDEKQRAEILPHFMRAGSQICLNGGEVYTTPGAVLGSANWLPPGATEIGEEQMAAAGGMEVLERMGEGAERFGTLMGTMAEVHHEKVPASHWYLLLLGVDPPRQGQGVGGTLIDPIIRRADADGLPCYLETMKPKNVTFYAKHGFDVVHEGDIDGTLHFWTMLRQPRAKM